MFPFYGAVVESVEDAVTIICRKKAPVYATNKSHLYYNRNVPAPYVELLR